ncbi:MAG: hypothetical protein AB7L76_04320, partial [Burkholderiaceae bacterium]
KARQRQDKGKTKAGRVRRNSSERQRLGKESANRLRPPAIRLVSSKTRSAAMNDADPVIRRADGSIDLRHYARRAELLHSQAMAAHRRYVGERARAWWRGLRGAASRRPTGAAGR